MGTIDAFDEGGFVLFADLGAVVTLVTPGAPQSVTGQPCLTNPEVRAVRNGALETGPVSWVQAPNPGFRSEPGVQAPFLGIRSRF